MLFKFPSKKYFYFNDEFTQTDDQGNYELTNDSMIAFLHKTVVGAAGNRKLTQEQEISLYYQFLLDHECLVKKGVVAKQGNSGKLSMPKSWIGKHVTYIVGVDE